MNVALAVPLSPSVSVTSSIARAGIGTTVTATLAGLLSSFASLTTSWKRRLAERWGQQKWDARHWHWRASPSGPAGLVSNV